MKYPEVFRETAHTRQGYWWHCRMSNDAVFSLWTDEYALKDQDNRNFVRWSLLRYANGHGANNNIHSRCICDPRASTCPYDPTDIVRVWHSRKEEV